MKRVLLLLAVTTAALPALAQNVVRPARPDVSAATRDVRPDAANDVSQAQIRAWLAAGASPARIRAYLQGLNDRPDVVRPTAVRPTAVRPTVARPEVAARGVTVQRSDITARPVLTPGNVQPAVPRADN